MAITQEDIKLGDAISEVYPKAAAAANNAYQAALDEAVRAADEAIDEIKNKYDLTAEAKKSQTPEEPPSPPQMPAEEKTADSAAAAAAENSAVKPDEPAEKEAASENATPTAEENDTAPEAAAPPPHPAAEIAKLKADLAERDDQLLRKQAEFQNFRRRSLKEKAEIGQVVTQNILKSLLPVLDNFERALNAEATDAQSLKKGVEMTYQNFCSILAGYGLAVIETKEKKFDPNFHQAVMRVENPDLEDGLIAMELQKGYQVGEAVIRPSMVQVVGS